MLRAAMTIFRSSVKVLWWGFIFLSLSLTSIMYLILHILGR